MKFDNVLGHRAAIVHEASIFLGIREATISTFNIPLVVIVLVEK